MPVEAPEKESTMGGMPKYHNPDFDTTVWKTHGLPGDAPDESLRCSVALTDHDGPVGWGTVRPLGTCSSVPVPLCTAHGGQPDERPCVGGDYCGRTTNGWFEAGSHGPGYYCGWCEALPA